MSEAEFNSSCCIADLFIDVTLQAIAFSEFHAIRRAPLARPGERERTRLHRHVDELCSRGQRGLKYWVFVDGSEPANPF